MLSCLRRCFSSNLKKVEEETSSRYDVTRYCRVRIGDTLGKKYQVLGKLGWGQFSTVWFAKNTENQQWVSVKVLTRTLLKDPRHERDVMHILREGDESHVGHSRVVHLLDAFVHKGVHGPHMCLVYRAMGESLSYTQPRFPGMRFPLLLMQRISRQLLQALDYIHTCGIIHADIYTDNILCELDDSVINSYLKIALRKEDMTRIGPNTPVSSTPMTAPENLMHINIRLSDFGQATYSLQHNDTSKVQHKDMRAPEVIMGQPWGTKIDIWNVACVIWEAFEQKTLFDGRIKATDQYSVQGQLREIVHFLGPAPEAIFMQQPIEYFDPGGTVKGLPSMEIPPLEDLEENLDGVGKDRFMDFLRSMLTWLPEDRPTAKQALEHAWLADEK